ncbi:c-type cytochrome [Roseovarius aestuariivivens]|uniref:c-type cytochrome n=1 Tax=Roseovarius aestuariivivens TaxID=1888910 RepID=UPI0010804202|nr:c-type cytochrome [Roseovarius aestuariivivens]
MKLKLISHALAALCIANSGQADESVLILGKGVYKDLCTNCHGVDGKGGGDIGELFAVTPPDLTKMSARNDGKFPFPKAYQIIISGQKVAGHGPLEMPVWGDYFMADALQDRGLSKSDSIDAAAGRALSVTYYLESIQE